MASFLGFTGILYFVQSTYRAWSNPPSIISLDVIGRSLYLLVTPPTFSPCIRFNHHILVSGKRIGETSEYKPGAAFVTIDFTIGGKGIVPTSSKIIRPIDLPSSVTPGPWDYWFKSVHHCPPAGLVQFIAGQGPIPVTVTE